MDEQEFNQFLEQKRHQGNVIGNMLGEHFDSFIMVAFSPEGAEAKFRSVGNRLQIRAFRDALREELDILDGIIEDGSNYHEM